MANKIINNGNGVMSYKQDDFSGGQNDTLSAQLLSDNQGQVVKDVSFDQLGTLFPRKGKRNRYNNLVGNSAITGLGAYYKFDGTTRLVFGTSDKLYYDEPHLDTKYETQSDFDKGLKGDHTISTGDEIKIDTTGQPSSVSETYNTKAKWLEGTGVNLDYDTTANSIQLVHGVDFDRVDNDYNDFITGTLSNVIARADNKLILQGTLLSSLVGTQIGDM